MDVAVSKKRTLGDLTVDLQPEAKRQRTVIVAATENKVGTIDPKSGIKRTSNLKSPTMILEGHKGAIQTTRFSPDGVHIASAGMDKDILIWHVYGECENHTVLRGHKGGILQIKWSQGNDMLFSASVDKTIGIWDVEYGIKIKKIKQHSSFVNSISNTKKGQLYLATASDDGSVRLYDIRIKNCIKNFDANFQQTSVEIDNHGLQLFSGGIDNLIKVWDCRKSEKPMYELIAHKDTITCLSLNYDNTKLLSNAMDCKLKIWDVRPWVNNNNNNDNFNHKKHEIGYENREIETQKRLIKTLIGAQHGSEKLLIKANWNKNGTQICSGSSDRMVYVFNAHSGKCEYRLPGHKGSVNEVDMHPYEPIIVSGSSDKHLFLGEL